MALSYLLHSSVSNPMLIVDQSIAPTDFFTVEVLTLRGLVTYYILFVLDLTSRTVKIAGLTAHQHEAWMVQMARNLKMPGSRSFGTHGS